jgi:hypothetical protein
VFPARYELNSYIVFRKRLVSKRLKDVNRREKRMKKQETERIAMEIDNRGKDKCKKKKRRYHEREADGEKE